MSHNRIDWTMLVGELRRMRAIGLSIEQCSERLGVNHMAVWQKCQALGINDRKSRGQYSGPAIVARDRARLRA